MTSTLARRRLLCNVQGRFYSAQAASKVSEPERVVLQRQETKVSKLPNGLTVASLENFSPISRVACIVNAGSRWETDNKGITHCLRVLSDKSTQSYSSFGLARTLQQAGGNLTCSSTRDYILYSLECKRDVVNDCVPYLTSAASEPAFRDWEVRDFQDKIANDLAVLKTQPNIVAYELLHKAAFRKSLGNSLYAPEYMLGKYTPQMLAEYVDQTYITNHFAVVGVGIDHDQLVEMCSNFTAPGGKPCTFETTKFGGGEIRQENDSPVVHAGLAVEGSSLSSKEMLAYSVLQHVMGTGPYIKWGSGQACNKLAQGAAQATDAPFSVSCFNSNYSDSGLFGLFAIAPASGIGAVLKGALQQFRQVASSNISEADLKRAKTQLSAAAQMSLENSVDMVEDLAVQALYNGQAQSAPEVVRAIDAVTAEDVQAVAKKVSSAKIAMAAVGDLSETPYLDELV